MTEVAIGCYICLYCVLSNGTCYDVAVVHRYKLAGIRQRPWLVGVLCLLLIRITTFRYILHAS